jgi:diguanylate cyclase (GGDEF)-like protein/PAS domain S-box-containing protein
MPSPILLNEYQRLDVLERLKILDTPSEPLYQDAAELAAQICGTKYAMITLIDKERQWFKAKVGTEVGETPRELSFCTHTLALGRPQVVENLTLDSRFDDNPLVHGDYHVRFYAGSPIYADNVAVGTICVIETEPQTLAVGQMDALNILARQVSANLELRLKSLVLALRETELEQALDRATEISSALAYSAKRFESLFHGLPVACATIDLDGLIMEWNINSEVIFGYQPGEVMFQDITEVLWPQFSEQERKQALRHIRAGSRGESHEFYVQCKDGSEICVLSNSLPLIGPRGELVGFIWSCINITDRKATEAALMQTNRKIEEQNYELEVVNTKLATMARTDGLTGLFNRHACLDYLERTFAEARATRQELAVVMLDVDHFKSFNDEFGHPEGDAVLKLVARTLSRSVGNHGFVARYGGEEFLVVLPTAGSEEAWHWAETLRKAITDQEWPKRPVTASFGFAVLSPDCGSIDELVRRADTALYESKRMGRNRASQYKGPSAKAS